MYNEFIVVGSGYLAVRVAETLKGLNYPVTVLEYKISKYSQLSEVCNKRKIDYKLLKKDEMTDYLLNRLSLGPICVISAINIYIFPKIIVEHENYFGINYHNALLPFHKGMNAEAWSIYDMDQSTGVTWHLIDTNIDEGKIIAQESIALDEDITSIKLLKKQSDLGYEIFKSFLDDLISDNLKTYSSEVDSHDFHFIAEVPNNGIIDNSWDFNKTYAFLRATDYGFLFTLGKPKILVDGKCYTISRYMIKPLDVVLSKDEIFINNNKVIINKKGENRSIYLNVTETGDDKVD